MIIATLLITILGIVIIYSSSVTLAIQQSIFALFGLVAFLILQNIDYRSLKGVIRNLYWVTFALLIVVFFIGVETRGALRWIPLGPFNFQPSEFAKVVLILTLA